jgi:ribosomal protein L28
MGNTVTLRGKAKYLGGVGTKVTGISRRKFKPNLQRLRITTGRGTSSTALVCTQCIKGGKVEGGEGEDRRGRGRAVGTAGPPVGASRRGGCPP